MKTNETILHGECIVTRVDTIPPTAKRIAVDGAFKIVAPSETTGNHHVVDTPVGVNFFQDGDTLFMESDVDTQIRCVMAERHDAVDLPAGTYEFGSQLEYDPFTARQQKVRD